MEVFILRNEQVKQNAIDTINSLEGLYEVVIRKHKKNLTGQQRNYWHACLEIIANHTGYTKEELKDIIKQIVLPLVKIEVLKSEPTKISLFFLRFLPPVYHDFFIRNKIILCPPSSETLTREQYSELIEATLMIAQSLCLSMPAANYYTGE